MFLFLTILAGFGAGVVTGLAGASAATIVTPVLTIFAGVPAYTAITIALFTDVFASAMSAFTFWKNDNIDLKQGMFLSIFVVSGSIVGSYASTFIDSSALGTLSILSILLVSINFLKKANRMQKEAEGLIEKEERKTMFANHSTLAVVGFGSLVGFLCGFVGAGGGLMILVILTSIIGVDTKIGVGTSVLVMTFTALSGGIAHLFNGVAPLPNGANLGLVIIVSGLASLVGASISARFANKTEEYNLLRIVAITFLVIIASGLLKNIIF